MLYHRFVTTAPCHHLAVFFGCTRNIGRIYPASTQVGGESHGSEGTRSRMTIGAGTTESQSFLNNHFADNLEKSQTGLASLILPQQRVSEHGNFNHFLCT